MSKFLRLTSGFLCLGVLAGVILASDLACPPRWDGNNPSLTEERGREEKLREMHEATRRRLEAKRQVAQEVIAQRRSLAEAIEQFRTLDRQWPECPPEPTLQALGISEDELDGLCVLDYVKQALADRPNEAAEVASRLQKELEELLAARKKRRPAPAEPRTKRSSRSHRTKRPVSRRQAEVSRPWNDSGDSNFLTSTSTTTQTV